MKNQESALNRPSARSFYADRLRHCRLLQAKGHQLTDAAIEARLLVSRACGVDAIGPLFNDLPVDRHDRARQITANVLANKDETTEPTCAMLRHACPTICGSCALFGVNRPSDLLAEDSVITEGLYRCRGVDRFLDSPPPPRDWLCADMITRRTVGGIFAAGGVGKSFFALHLAVALATGKQWGPFRPTRANKVVYLAGEDSEQILWERLRSMVGSFPGTADNAGQTDLSGVRRNLEPVDLCGVADKALVVYGPNGNPTTSKTYEKLRASLAAQPAEVLIIDTLSRFYALDENSNPHAAFWIDTLEGLARDFNLTVLFIHHENKAQAVSGDLKNSKGRGASAFFDNSRFALTMAKMDEQTATDFDVNPLDFIRVANTKNSYGREWPSVENFRRNGDGTLSHVNLHLGRRDRQVDTMLELIAEAPGGVSQRDIERAVGAGKRVASELKTAFPKISIRREIPLIIAKAIEAGVLEVRREVIGKTKRDSLMVVDRLAGTPDKRSPDNPGQNCLSGAKSAPAAEKNAGQTIDGQTPCPASILSGANSLFKPVSDEKMNAGQGRPPKGGTKTCPSFFPPSGLGASNSVVHAPV